MKRSEKKIWRSFRDSCKRNGTMVMFNTALLRHTNKELEKGLKKIETRMEKLERDCVAMGYKSKNE